MVRTATRSAPLGTGTSFWTAPWPPPKASGVGVGVGGGGVKVGNGVGEPETTVRTGLAAGVGVPAGVVGEAREERAGHAIASTASLIAGRSAVR